MTIFPGFSTKGTPYQPTSPAQTNTLQQSQMPSNPNPNYYLQQMNVAGNTQQNLTAQQALGGSGSPGYITSGINNIQLGQNQAPGVNYYSIHTPGQETLFFKNKEEFNTYIEKLVHDKDFKDKMNKLIDE